MKEKQHLRAQIGELQEELRGEKKQREALQARLTQVGVKLGTNGDIASVRSEAGGSRVLGAATEKGRDKDAMPENEWEQTITQTPREQVGTRAVGQTGRGKKASGDRGRGHEYALLRRGDKRKGER